MNKSELTQLKHWFLCQARDLPWRDSPTPYAVWISEVMLQQTQVSVVVPYFERWIKRFPSIEALANAPLDVVLKQWEGLGYYARARHLHEGARYVLENFNGELPSSPEQLKQIKGLGSYTIGAILSFAFHQREAAVDGNVVRVLARYYALTDDVGKAKTMKKIQVLAEDLLPEHEPWVVAEALIELGATVCTRTPGCLQCPLKNSCNGYLKGMADQLPVKSNKTTTESLYRAVAVVFCGDRLLVSRGAKGKIMADLYEFPYFEVDQGRIDNHTLQQLLDKHFPFKVEWRQALSQVSHSFTRYRALLTPHLFSVSQPGEVLGYEWISLDVLKTLALSSGHRRIFAEALIAFSD